MATESAVVETMQERAAELVRELRKHRERGTAETPEALALFEEYSALGEVIAGELANRRAYGEKPRRDA